VVAQDLYIVVAKMRTTLVLLAATVSPVAAAEEHPTGFAARLYYTNNAANAATAVAVPDVRCTSDVTGNADTKLAADGNSIDGALDTAKITTNLAVNNKCTCPTGEKVRTTAIAAGTTKANLEDATAGKWCEKLAAGTKLDKTACTAATGGNLKNADGLGVCFKCLDADDTKLTASCPADLPKCASNECALGSSLDTAKCSAASNAAARGWAASSIVDPTAATKCKCTFDSTGSATAKPTYYVHDSSSTHADHCTKSVVECTDNDDCKKQFADGVTWDTAASAATKIAKPVCKSGKCVAHTCPDSTDAANQHKLKLTATWTCDTAACTADTAKFWDPTATATDTKHLGACAAACPTTHPSKDVTVGTTTLKVCTLKPTTTTSNATNSTTTAKTAAKTSGAFAAGVAVVVGMAVALF